MLNSIPANCVIIKERGILLLGESGSGKSDLTLRLIDRGARLVADDQVLLVEENHILTAAAPRKIAGLLELRGIGIITLPYDTSIPLTLAVQLMHRDSIERLPPPQDWTFLGVSLPLFQVDARDASAPVKIETALQALLDGRFHAGVLS